jgi:hypothetical protein
MLTDRVRARLLARSEPTLDAPASKVLLDFFVKIGNRTELKSASTSALRASIHRMKRLLLNPSLKPSANFSDPRFVMLWRS